MERIKTVVICGPTACGKTRLGVSLAARFNGEIISADSRQVYRTLDIGTGKDLDEYMVDGRHIPYHAIDIAGPEEIFTLFMYMEEFNRSFNEIHKNGKIPVIVGGTGLYIEACLKQYDVPHAPENPGLRAHLMEMDQKELVFMLEGEKDLFESTDITSKKRIVRSLEIAAYRKDGNDQLRRREQIPPLEYLIIGVYYPREEIHRRIRTRLEARLSHGMVDEVERLIALVPKERVLMLGMEYAHVARYIWGEVTYQQMFESLFQSIRHLAKRQMTWFRGMERRGLPVHWIEGESPDKAEALVTSFIGTE